MSSTEDLGSSLREFMEEMGPPWWARPRPEFHFPIDVQEKDNEYIVRASLPGVIPQQVNIEAQDNTLRISGEIPEEQPEEPGQWLLRERPTGHFMRMVTFPMNSYNTRRGADYSVDQLSRFIDRGVREKMQRVVVEAPADLPPPAPDRPEPVKTDLFELLRSRFTPPANS